MSSDGASNGRNKRCKSRRKTFCSGWILICSNRTGCGSQGEAIRKEGFHSQSIPIIPISFCPGAELSSSSSKSCEGID